MSKVNILWMYDDLLDLYGDWGNLLAVTKGLDAMGISWEIDHKSLGDQPDFSRYQMVYIGPGKARNLAEAAKDLAGKKQAVLDAVESGVVFLATGNSRLLFGKALLMPEGSRYPVLGCLTIRAKRPATFLFLTYWLIRYSRQKPHLTVLSTEPPIFMAMTGTRSLL